MASDLTIDEAIKHAEEVAHRKCNECGRQHQQLANWLKELVELRECMKEAVEWSCGNPDEACEDCVAHGGDTPCKCEKWRKALDGEKSE